MDLGGTERGEAGQCWLWRPNFNSKVEEGMKLNFHVWVWPTTNMELLAHENREWLEARVHNNLCKAIKPRTCFLQALRAGQEQPAYFRHQHCESLHPVCALVLSHHLPKSELLLVVLADFAASSTDHTAGACASVLVVWCVVQC